MTKADILNTSGKVICVGKDIVSS